MKQKIEGFGWDYELNSKPIQENLDKLKQFSEEYKLDFNLVLLLSLFYYSSEEIEEFQRQMGYFPYDSCLTLLNKFDKNLSWNIDSRFLEGLVYNKIGIDKTLKGNNTFSFNFKSMYRLKYLSFFHSTVLFIDKGFLIYPDEWKEQQRNNTLNATFTHSYSFKNSSGSLSFGSRTSAIFSDYNFASLAATWRHNTALKYFYFKQKELK